MSLPELTRTPTSQREGAPQPRERNVFTVRAEGERLAIPVECVHTIFRISRITPVPGAPREVLGLANLRGKIVTVVSLRRRLGLPDRETTALNLAIGIEYLGESIALTVDEVGDVIGVLETDRIAPPPHLSRARLGVTAAVYRYEDGVMSLLDIGALFNFAGREPAGPESMRLDSESGVGR